LQSGIVSKRLNIGVRSSVSLVNYRLAEISSNKMDPMASGGFNNDGFYGVQEMWGQL